MSLTTVRGLSLVLFVFWMVCAVLATLSFNAQLSLGTMRMSPVARPAQIVAMQFAPWLSIAVLTPLVVWLAHRFPLSRTAWRSGVLVHHTFVRGLATAAGWCSCRLPPSSAPAAWTSPVAACRIECCRPGGVREPFLVGMRESG